MQEFIANSYFRWMDKAWDYARTLFALLVAVELAWSTIVWALEKTDLQSLTAALIRKLMWIGFFGLLILWGPYLIGAFMGSFDQAGTEIANEVPGGLYRGGESTKAGPSTLTSELGTQMSPVGFVKDGLFIFRKITGYSFTQASETSGLHLQEIVAMTIATVYIIVAAMLFVFQTEAMFVLSVGLIFLGAGGSKFTEQFVTRYLTYAIGVGIKVFVFVTMLAMLSPHLRKTVAALMLVPEGQTVDLTTAMPLFAQSIMLAVLVRTIPSIAASFATNIGTTEAGISAAAGAQQMRSAYSQGGAWKASGGQTSASNTSGSTGLATSTAVSPTSTSALQAQQVAGTPQSAPPRLPAAAQPAAAIPSSVPGASQQVSPPSMFPTGSSLDSGDSYGGASSPPMGGSAARSSTVQTSTRPQEQRGATPVASRSGE
jgi:type IV secretion system protein TrbL